MANQGATENNIWPLPRFTFQVEWGGVTFAVQEITGLDSETQPVEYRHSNSKTYAPIKMPGLTKVSNVTVKKGIFVKDDRFWKWYNEIKMNTIARQLVKVQLLDENGAMQMQWELQNAWPTKINGTDLKSDANEVAIESIEIAYEVMQVSIAG
ncbi:MAG: phage tail protein [Bacteroidota bacterium]